MAVEFLCPTNLLLLGNSLNRELKTGLFQTSAGSMLDNLK